MLAYPKGTKGKGLSVLIALLEKEILELIKVFIQFE